MLTIGKRKGSQDDLINNRWTHKIKEDANQFSKKLLNGTVAVTSDSPTLIEKLGTSTLLSN
jgi:hypothetical protein